MVAGGHRAVWILADVELKEFLREICGFLLESTPERRDGAMAMSNMIGIIGWIRPVQPFVCATGYLASSTRFTSSWTSARAKDPPSLWPRIIRFGELWEWNCYLSCIAWRGKMFASTRLNSKNASESKLSVLMHASSSCR